MTTNSTEPQEQQAAPVQGDLGGIIGLDDPAHGPVDIPPDDSGPTDIPSEEPAAPVAEAPPAPVVEAPQAPLAPEPPPDPAALQQENEAARAENERLRMAALSMAQQQAAQQQSQQTQQDAVNYAQSLVAQGYTEEQAVAITRQQVQAYQQFVNQQIQSQGMASWQEQKFHAALEYSEKYGVPAKDLLRYNDRATMEEAAQNRSRIAKLETGQAAATRAEVPVQSFDNSAGAPAAVNDQETLLASARGKSWDDMTPAELAAYRRQAGIPG